MPSNLRWTRAPLELPGMTQHAQPRLRITPDAQHPLAGIPTGLPRLDRQLAVLRAGALSLLAGRSAVACTSLALNLARHVAGLPGAAVILLCPASSELEVALRLLSIEAGMDTDRLRRMGMQAAAQAAVARLHGLRLLAGEAAALGPDELAARYREQCAGQKGPHLLIANECDLVNGLDATANALRLKILSDEVGCATLLVCRLPEQGPPSRFFDLRRSGLPLDALETILMLQLEAQDGERGTGPTSALLQVFQPQQGKLRTAHLAYNEANGRFLELG